MPTIQELMDHITNHREMDFAVFSVTITATDHNEHYTAYARLRAHNGTSVSYTSTTPKDALLGLLDLLQRMKCPVCGTLAEAPLEVENVST